MIYLIVPPIIIVLAIAMLVVFLARNISLQHGSRDFVVKQKKRSLSKWEGVQKAFIPKKKEKGGHAEENNDVSEGIVKEGEKGNKVYDDNSQTSSKYARVMRGITRKKKSGENIVSLRKKSMVSDKIENAEGRDPEEIALMNEIEKHPQDSKGYAKLGDYYMEHEQFEDARDCYKYVLRLDPRHKRAQVAMKNLDRVLCK